MRIDIDTERAVEINCRTCKHWSFLNTVCRDCGRKSMQIPFYNWEIGDHEIRRMKSLHPDFDPQKFMDERRNALKEANDD